MQAKDIQHGMAVTHDGLQWEILDRHPRANHWWLHSRNSAGEWITDYAHQNNMTPVNSGSRQESILPEGTPKMSTFNIHSVKPGDILDITRDGHTSRMTVSRVEPAGSSGRAYSAGPSVSAAIRPGGYATTFDSGTIAAGYIQVTPAPSPAAGVTDVA
jgi:hypothetical protein